MSLGSLDSQTRNPFGGAITDALPPCRQDPAQAYQTHIDPKRTHVLSDSVISTRLSSNGGNTEAGLEVGQARTPEIGRDPHWYKHQQWRGRARQRPASQLLTPVLQQATAGLVPTCHGASYAPGLLGVAVARWGHAAAHMLYVAMLDHICPVLLGEPQADLATIPDGAVCARSLPDIPLAG